MSVKLNITVLTYCLIVINCLSKVSVRCHESSELASLISNSTLGRADFDLVVSTWNAYRDEVKIDLDLLTSGLASQLDQILIKSNVSSRCSQGLRLLLDQCENKKTWAFQALDSWGRFPPPGLLSGTTTSFGSFDQCLNVITPNSTFHSQYCTILFRPLLPHRPRFHNILNKPSIFEAIPRSSLNNNVVEFIKSKAHFFYYTQIRVGICLTTHCDQDEISSMVKTIAEGMYLKGEVSRCESKPMSPVNLNNHQTIALFIILTIIVANLIGTVAELLIKPGSRLEPFCSLLFAFSIRRNFVSLFKTETSNTELKCLNGLRSITMAWIIFGHTSVWIHYHAFSHSFNIVDVITPFGAQALLNVTLSVDTFFLISGLLTSYVTWKTTDGVYSKFNSFAFIISRYTRLTPLLLAAICLTLFLPLIGSGPLWQEFVAPIGKRCEENWWINLLYIQAFYKTGEICLLPTWWLSNDMLFHIISLLILVPLMRSQKLGIAMNLIIISIFTLASAFINYTQNYPPAILPTFPQVEDYWRFVYEYFWKPYLHGPSFFIGLHLGYLLARKRFAKMNKTASILGWIISISVLFIVFHAPYPLTMGKTWPREVNTIFDCTNRVLWALSISWVIYASASGHGGFIGKLLSLPIFGPFAKITYAVYLTHMFIIWAFMGSRRDLTFTSTYTGINMFVSHWVLAQILGTFAALLFESPFLNIQKSFAKQYQKKEDTVSLRDWDKEEINKKSLLINE